MTSPKVSLSVSQMGTPREPPSPCVGVCSTTALGDRVCRGCKRFAHEIVAWNSYRPEQKQAVEQRLQGFIQRVMEDKLHVADAALLLATLEELGLGCPLHRSAHAWAYELLTRAGPRLQSLSRCGLRVLPGWRHLPPAELGLLVEREFRRLSEEYYEHRLRRPLRW